MTLPTCGAFCKEMSCVKIHTHIVWVQEQFLQWSFKWTILQTFLHLLPERGGIGVQDAVPTGMAPIDAVHAGVVPAGPIPAIAVAAAPDAVPAGRARGRARDRGQARGRAGQRTSKGLTMQLQMQMQKLMKVAKLTNQILILKPIRRIGGPEVAMPCVLAGAVAFCKLGGAS